MTSINATDEGPDSEVFPDLTRDVIDRMKDAANPRLRAILSLVVGHLHTVVREAGITHDEWFQAIDFLTRAGKMCSDSRQELILLSDILGVSMLVDAIDHVGGSGLSESTVLGPFYAGRQRELAAGESILLREEEGEALEMRGHVTDAHGRPIVGALVRSGRPRPIKCMTFRTRISLAVTFVPAFGPTRQAHIDFAPSGPSAIRFPTTARPVSCSPRWGAIHFGRPTFIS